MQRTIRTRKKRAQLTAAVRPSAAEELSHRVGQNFGAEVTLLLSLLCAFLRRDKSKHAAEQSIVELIVVTGYQTATFGQRKSWTWVLVRIIQS